MPKQIRDHPKSGGVLTIDLGPSEGNPALTTPGASTNLGLLPILLALKQRRWLDALRRER